MLWKEVQAITLSSLTVSRFGHITFETPLARVAPGNPCYIISLIYMYQRILATASMYRSIEEFVQVPIV